MVGDEAMGVDAVMALLLMLVVLLLLRLSSIVRSSDFDVAEPHRMYALVASRKQVSF